MAPPCRKIRYKEGRRSSKPVVKIKKPLTPVSESPVSNSDYSQQYFPAEEEEYEEPKPIQPTVNQIQCLRRWLQKQRFIPQDLSDDFLKFFLLVSEYDLKIAANRVLKYFLLRQEPSPLFRDRDPLSPANVEIFKKLYVLPVPDTTEDGKKIILTGLVEPMAYYNQMEHLKAFIMVFDLLIWEKDFGFGDYVVVLDGTGFQCPQLLENKVYNHRSIKSLLLDTIPGTLRSFFLLYPPPYVANIADNRNGIWITVVKSKQEMTSYLPADILPLEYGGNLGHLRDLLGQWQLHMVQNRDFFIRFETRMICNYMQRLRYEQEVSTRSKNWVQEMKLEADEWEYKIQYYKKMKEKKPLRHTGTKHQPKPGFGSLRKPIERQIKTIERKGCWKYAKEEAAKFYEPTFLSSGYGKEIPKPHLEAETQKTAQYCIPILELEIFYP